MSYKALFAHSKFRFLLIALCVVVPFEILSFFSIHLPGWIEIPLFLMLIILFGKEVFKSGFQSLVHLNFSDINLLMTIAIAGALYLGEYEEAVIIVILFALGNALEDFGIERSQTALKKLVDKTPKSAQIKGHTQKTPVEDIKAGEILVIKPGDYIALDGVVLKGGSLVDETAITGEPLPKNKYIGDSVYAGTINGSGYIEVKVTKEAQYTTLAKIIDLTYKSAEKKSQTQKFIEQFAQYYTPAVLVIAGFLVIIPVFFLGLPFDVWFTQGLTLLLISCPCALVISTPITIFSAIGNATQKGILIKGGRFLEDMGKIKAIAFDKTRTITQGNPTVSDIVPFNGVSKGDLLACIAGMEIFSEHPIAKSIVDAAKDKNLISHVFTDFQAVVGKGVKGECTVCFDKHHCMGTIKFITEEHAVEKKVIEQVERFEKQGKTTIVISDNKKVTGVISIIDAIRPEAKPTIQSLFRQNINPIMLTGDNSSTAQYVAHQVGINDVKAELLPQKKVEELSLLLKKFKYVAMVGDGINDAPALTTATVGISMGAIGSDVAVENSDIALMNNNLNLIPYLVNLGRKSVATIRINTSVAVGTKLVFLVLALLGKSNLTLAIFVDVGLTLAVVANSLRLFN